MTEGVVPSHKMTSNNTTPLRTAALIAGSAILTMAIAAPFAELYVYPKLVAPGNAADIAKNIIANEALFVSGIMGYLITFICDIVAAWALYILLKPVSENLSLLTSWFRLVYSIIAVIALLNLVMVFRLLKAPDYLTVFEPDRLYAQALLFLHAFKREWHFGILFFGIHLGLLGYLVLRSSYIPKIMGVLLIIAGIGYLVTTLGPYLFPTLNLRIAQYTFYGELIFMLWLLIRGSRLKEASQ